MIAAQAAQLVQVGVRALLASGSTEALLSMKASAAIPIVFWSSDPIAENRGGSHENVAAAWR